MLRNNIDIEVFFGLVFALNGAKVKILIDDGILYHWDTLQFDNWNTFQINKENPKIIKIDRYQLNPLNYNFRRILTLKNHLLDVFLQKRIIKKALNAYKVENMEYIYYSDIINRNEVKYENLEDLKKHAESSSIRFFRNCDLDYNNKYIRYYYNLSLKNAILCRNIGKFVFYNLKPDLFLTSHGMYSTHGSTYEFLKENGIKCRLYITLSYTNKYYIKFIDTKEQTLSRCKFWHDYKNKPLTEEMRKKVDNYFSGRFKGSTVDIKVHSKYIKNTKSFIENSNDKYKYHIILFSNIIFDGNIRDRHFAFDGLLDWLLSTIEYVKNRKDIKLYIRAHPREKRFSRNTPKIFEILSKYIDINTIENIVPISSDFKINTYEFVKNKIDLVIIYDGFLGLELPYLGIPTIICAGDGMTNVVGANKSIKNKEEYFNYLENVDKLINEYRDNRDIIRDNVIRYVYWYLFEDRIELPSFKFGLKFNNYFNLKFLNKRDLLINKNLIDLFN
ncbi:MAG: hypothetical protein ACFFAH_00165 [Promethearchaeota archaeon]